MVHLKNIHDNDRGMWDSVEGPGESKTQMKLTEPLQLLRAVCKAVLEYVCANESVNLYRCFASLAHSSEHLSTNAPSKGSQNAVGAFPENRKPFRLGSKLAYKIKKNNLLAIEYIRKYVRIEKRPCITAV